MIQGLHHVAVAVKDAEAAARIFVDVLGLPVRVVEIEDQQLKLALIQLGDVLLEFIQPTGDDQPYRFAEYIATRGEGLHHLAYEVTDIEATMALLREQGVEFLSDTPSRGTDGWIAFARPEKMAGVLTEFVQKAG